MIKSLLIAFAMYSKVPMPFVKWEKENMKYVLALFPLVGVLEGVFFLMFWKAAMIFKMAPLLRGAGLFIIPLLYTGGIHMDGFMDVLDAKASHQDRRFKLAVLKDSHVGSGAVIGAIMFSIVYTAALVQFDNVKQVLLMDVAFVMIRAYSALSLACFKNARGEGLAMTFSDAAEICVTRTILVLFVLICVLGMIYISHSMGIVVAAAGFVVFLYYRLSSHDEFGGVTGDLAGYFLELCELIIAIIVALAV